MKGARTRFVVDAAAAGGEPRALGARLRVLLPIVLAAALFAAVAALGAAHVTLKLRELEAGHALGELHKERAELEKEQRRLHIELGTLKSPERIQRLAKEKLGLQPPKPAQLGSVPP